MSDPAPAGGDAYDLAIVGGGPGGYAAAIAASQAGLRAVCIDERETLGGACLNVGCIPSKTLLHWSERFEEAGSDYAARGIRLAGVELDLPAMMAEKERTVARLTGGVARLFEGNGVDRVVGAARLVRVEGRPAVAVDGADGERRTVAAHRVVIAAGSEPAALPGVAVDGERIVDSTGALSFSRVPRRLAVIGAGYIGLELGSVWRRLGAEVTVVEALDRIAPGMDRELAERYRRLLARQGLAFRLSTRVSAAQAHDDGVALALSPAGGAAETLQVDAVLVAVGRRPRTGGLGLEEAGVALDERGFVMVDGDFQTNVEGVHAIGDVIGGAMLAHKATAEAHALVETLSGARGAVDYDAVPAAIYTEPEAAWVGRNEEELTAAGAQFRKGRFPFSANSRAATLGRTEGFVKVLADARTDRLLGVHALGADASALIAEAALAMAFGGSAEDIARTCHAHPTLSEALMEAASVAVFGKSLHLLR